MRIQTLVKSILERLSECPKPFKIAACFFLLGLVAAIDYATGVEISVSAFYPIPVVFMAWIAGRRSAVGMAALAAFTQLAASSVRLTRSWPKWTASCTRRRGAEGIWRERHNPR
jgi:hypothetical protein